MILSTNVSTHRPSLHICVGCSNPINEGSVMSFGEALFHLNCFSCAKCHQQVDSQSNLILSTDGRPVCEECSYICKKCGQSIGEEAVVTGNESYHAECFQCIACNKTIDDLIYTQTSKGIYCTACHQTSKKIKETSIMNRPLPSIPLSSSLSTPSSSSTQSVTPEFQLRKSAQVEDASVNFHVTSSVSPSSSQFLSFSSTPSSSSSSSSSLNSSSPSSPPTKMKLTNVLGSTPLTASLSESSSSTKRSNNTPTATASTRTASNTASKPLTLALPDIPSLNLSFFDDDSSELSNLTQSLGVNLSSTTTSTKSRPGNIGATKLNRISELLKDSLNDLSPSTSTSTASTTSKVSDDKNSIPINVEELQQKLRFTTERLASTNANFEKLKTASQKALDEFTKAKEEFAKEMSTRQQHEYTILQLRHQLAGLQQHHHQSLPSASPSSTSSLSSISNLSAEKEIDRLASVKVELERSCNQLKQYRDQLATQIDEKVQQAQAGLASSVLEHHQLALQEHIRSLVKERDALQLETKELNKTRDEVIHEMVVLNTKNAELSSMNNDLSRRMTEREREAAAIMAGTAFIHHTPSPSPSTELLVRSPVSMERKSSETSILMQRMTSRDSTNSKDGSSNGSSKMFKMKRSKANVFNKITSYGASFTNNNSNGNLNGGNSSNNSSNKKADQHHHHHYHGSSPPRHAFYGAHENQSLYNLNTTSSVNMLGEMKRKGSKQSCDSTTSPGSHSFVATSFLRPVKCAACDEKIWGATEYRCQGCGSVCHMKCMAYIPALCYATSSSLELVSPTDSEGSKPVSMFGTSLAARVALEDRDVPLLVQQCIDAVEARGMDYEGIYRKSGGAAQMRTIQLAFETNELLDLKNEDEINDICAVTSVLKQYFRELPNPLLTYELYDQFMDAVRTLSGDAKADRFIELISQLPKANYDTMKLLMTHLDNVRKQSESNLMTTKNLAMVFGPTLLRDKDASRDLLDMSYKNATIEYIINHTQLLFAN